SFVVVDATAPAVLTSNRTWSAPAGDACAGPAGVPAPVSAGVHAWALGRRSLIAATIVAVFGSTTSSAIVSPSDSASASPDTAVTLPVPKPARVAAAVANIGRG